MKIAVTGANGFLGSRLCKAFEKHEIIAAARRDFDIANEAEVLAFLKSHRPDALIHCAALSDVAACEQNPELSRQVNVLGTENIAKACRALSIKLIFCSSDQVYVGLNGDKAHKENEPVNPPHPYGQHKVMAENHCRTLCESSVCLRLAWMYDAAVLPGEGRGGLVGNVMTAIQKGEALSYPDNDFRSITNVWEVVKQMERAMTLPGDIYNFGSENVSSTYEVVSHILQVKKLTDVPLHKNKTASPAAPRNIRMDTGKAQAHGIHFYQTLEGLEGSLTHHF